MASNPVVRSMGVMESEAQRTGGGSWLPTLADAKRQADLVAMTDIELRSVYRTAREWYHDLGKPRHGWRMHCARILLLERGASL